MSMIVNENSEDFPAQLLELIDTYFDEEELRELCFKLTIEYDSLGGRGKKYKARELIGFVTRRNRLAKLLRTLRIERPNVSWPTTSNPHPAEQSDTPHTFLPTPTYHQLIGRFQEMDEIMNVLRNPSQQPIVAITGLGGIGKTAIAYEIIEKTSQEKRFDHTVWMSYKDKQFIGEGVVHTDASNTSFDELLNAIGRQCNRYDIPKLPLNQKPAHVKHLLSSQQVLIVLDNMETAHDSEKLISSIAPMLGQSKLVVTSRHHTRHDKVFSLKLRGLLEDESISFLRMEGKIRGITVIARAERSHLVQIYEVTGGLPLAMKLVVGQANRLPLDVVLHTLRKAKVRGQDYEFYRFIYKHSWDLLDLPSKMAFVDLSVFPPGTGGTVKDVQIISEVAPEDFWVAMDQLVSLSLVDKTGSIERERYSLHPVTQYFIKSDITKEWSDR